jgi:hypothetical protein
VLVMQIMNQTPKTLHPPLLEVGYLQPLPQNWRHVMDL